MEKKLWLEELAAFIVEANRNTYAADSGQVTPERKGYKELEYAQGLWRLRDSYTGYFRAPGMTTVYFNELPAWTMVYGGRGQHNDCLELVQPTFDFLKAALMKVSVEMPFRGPSEFTRGGWVYRFSLRRGDLSDFEGEEYILRTFRPVFSQIVFGGIVIPKDEHRNPQFPWNF